jgi:hypothetical protein
MVSGLSEAAQQFLWERIEDYAQFDMLLLLHRHATRVWTIEATIPELKLPHAEAVAALDHLTKHRLLERCAGEVHGYRYSPTDTALEACVQELALAWEENRLAIISLMNSHALSRIRNAALRTFSNAFRLRGPQND